MAVASWLLVLFAALDPARAAPSDQARAAAEEAASCLEQGDSRRLGGHTFVPLELVSWPFITTHFGFKIGAGAARIPGVGIDLEGDPLTTPVWMLALTQGFSLGIGLFDRLTLRAGFGGLVATGESLEKILGAGALLNFKVGGGVFLRLLELSRFIFSIGTDFALHKGKFVTPGLAIYQAILTRDLNAATGNLLLDAHVWYFQPALAAAFAPLDLIGLQTSVAVNVGSARLDDSWSSTVSIDWAIGVGLDLQRFNVPIAIPAAYQLGVSLKNGHRAEHHFEAGVYYSGRPNLDLGVSFQTRVGAWDEDAHLGLLRMNYFW